MEELERRFEILGAQGALPSGIVVAASSIDGSLDYLQAFSNSQGHDESISVLTTSTFCLASATKLITSIAAIQCVECGLISLDDPISTHVPEFTSPSILSGYTTDNTPILVPSKRPITLRHLLTHTSGISGFEDQRMEKWYASKGDKKATLIQRYFMSQDVDVKAVALEEIRQTMGELVIEPLLFEPGTNWVYGQSTDWAGQLVERLTKQTLESYCQTHIFGPLGMSSSTFRLLNNSQIRSRVLPMTSRNSEGRFDEVPSIYRLDPKLDMGGSNLYSSAPDMMALLSSLLKNDGKILKPTTTGLLFSSSVCDPSILNSADKVEFFSGMSGVEDGKALDHCLAGLVNTEDLESGRKAGSICWQGATKCFWWVDRTAGVCGFYGSQVIGWDQGWSRGIFGEFESAVYKWLAETDKVDDEVLQKSL